MYNFVDYKQSLPPGSKAANRLNSLYSKMSKYGNKTWLYLKNSSNFGRALNFQVFYEIRRRLYDVHLIHLFKWRWI